MRYVDTDVGNFADFFLKTTVFENYIFQSTATSSRVQWVKDIHSYVIRSNRPARNYMMIVNLDPQASRIDFNDPNTKIILHIQLSLTAYNVLKYSTITTG